MIKRQPQTSMKETEQMKIARCIGIVVLALAANHAAAKGIAVNQAISEHEVLAAPQG